MKQSKKGQQRYFGMKCHIGVDAESGPGAHGVRHDRQRQRCGRGQQACCTARARDAWGDAGYQGAPKRDDASPDVTWHVAMKARRALDKTTLQGAITERIEKIKVSIRAKVEHPFWVIKRQF